MTSKSVLTRISLLLFCIGLAACSKDDLQDDDFEIPPLTEDNTIQFTVPIEKDGYRQLEIAAEGGRIAIDWGDGRVQRITDPFNHRPIHKYGNVGRYKVKIWAEEISGLNLLNILLPVEDVHLGYFPRMRQLTLNTCNATKELDVSKSCPNVTYLNIGNCADLERVDITKCIQLTSLSIYTNSKLTELDLSHNINLNGTLDCTGNNLTTLSVKGLSKINEIHCSWNPLLSNIEVDEEGMKISKITASECGFTSMDFLEKLPSLRQLICNKNQLTSLKLATYPQHLDCSDNLLEEITFPKAEEPEGKYTRSWTNEIDCHSNKLSETALNHLFDLLAPVPDPHSRMNNNGTATFEGKIAYWDNPGENNCNTKVLEEKGWTIIMPKKENGKLKVGD